MGWNIKAAMLKAQKVLGLSQSGAEDASITPEEKINAEWANRIAENLNYIIHANETKNVLDGKAKTNVEWNTWLSEIAERLSDINPIEQEQFIHDDIKREELLALEIHNYMRDIIHAEQNGYITKAAMKEELQSRIDLLMGFETIDKSKLAYGEALKAIEFSHDLEAILDHGRLDYLNNPWIDYEWNMYPADTAKKDSETIIYEASAAAANISQNILLMVNKHPELASQATIQNAIDAAEALSFSIADGYTQVEAPNALNEWEQHVRIGFEAAIKASNTFLNDRAGNVINIHHYLDDRFERIHKATAYMKIDEDEQKPNTHAKKALDSKDKPQKRAL